MALRSPTTHVGRTMLEGLHAQLRNCRRCGLCQFRKRVVFGAGNPRAPVMVIGNRPGYWDDDSGEPLAGETTRGIFAQALDRVGLLMQRDIYATYAVKCLTPKEDDQFRSEPTAEAFAACNPFLQRQIDLINPAIIVLHGKGASSMLLGDSRSLRHYLGHWRTFGHQRIVLSTHNPAGLFGERSALVPEYFQHWEELACRLHGLGRLWRPDAQLFRDGWVYPDQLLENFA